jgi:hypothetical protein
MAPALLNNKLIRDILWEARLNHKFFVSNIFAVILAVSSVFLASQNSYATEESHVSPCLVALSKIKELDVNKGKSWRGFLGVFPLKTEETAHEAAKKGIFPWDQWIYLVKGENDIIDHDVLQDNILLKGVYIVDAEPISEEMFKDVFNASMGKRNQSLKAQAKFARAVNKGVYTVEYDIDISNLMKVMSTLSPAEKILKREELKKHARIVKLDPQFVKENFPSEKLIAKRDGNRDEIHWSMPGWFSPAYRGVVVYEDMMQSKKSYKTLMKIARKLHDQGATFNFTLYPKDGSESEKLAAEKQYMTALNLLKRQERFRINLKTGERTLLDESSNRYIYQDTIDLEMKLFKSGHSILFANWDAQGQLIAGTIIHKAGNQVEPDTVFYDKKVLENAYEVTKILGYALAGRLNEAGIPFLDAGMASNYTQSIHGKYVLRIVFTEMNDSLPKEDVAVDFSSPWIPPVTEDPAKDSKKTK